MTEPADRDGPAQGYATERRASPRSPSSASVTVEWRDGSSFRAAKARLGNVGPGGALASTSVAPPVGTPVRLALVGRAFRKSIGARVLGVVEVPGLPDRPGTSYRVRLEFDEPCPPEFFAAAAEA